MSAPVRSLSDFIPKKPSFYNGFMGMDVSRDKSFMDTGEKQHMVSMVNCYADWRGAIVTDNGAHRRRNCLDGVIKAMRFYSRDGLCWAQEDGAGVSLNSDKAHKEQDVYQSGSIVTFSNFGGEVRAMCAGRQSYVYSGFAWRKARHAIKPGFGVAIQDRLAVSGDPEKPSVIVLSRAEDADIMLDEEDPKSSNVLKASFIDIRSKIDSADWVTGLGAFEVNRLAIFTNDQCIVYKVAPSFEDWTIDERANLRTGCISHATICPAGNDLLFCSRRGIHALRRADANGLTIVEMTMSDKVEAEYKRLVATVADPRDISACFDSDNGQYHVFFPQAGSIYSTRLTLSVRTGAEYAAWSTGDFLQARTGAFLAGSLVFGTMGGIYNVLGRSARVSTNEQTVSDVWPTATCTTPILWHGSISDTKETKSIMIHASGSGSIDIDVFNESGDRIDSIEVEFTEDDASDTFPFFPLERQYERMFSHRYRGVQMKFTLRTESSIKLLGFAIILKKDA
jgi:hypothetical protein